MTCDGANLPRTAGTYTTCGPRGDAYLWTPQHQVDFLATLAPDPGRVVITVIAGDPSPFSVGLRPVGTPFLAAACTGTAGTAVPAVRLASFARTFPRGVATSVCASEYATTLASTAGRVLCAGP